METTLSRFGVFLPQAGAVTPKTKTAGATGVEHEEFDAIVREHQRRIYRVLLAILRDPDAADTLTQECFLRAYRKRESFRGESSVGTWLVRIAINLARDHIRSRRRGFWMTLLGSSESAMAAAARVPDRGASPERELAAREELAAVWAAVESLSSQQKEVFFLRFSEEMPLEEIAQTMDLQTGTVKSHLARALSAIRQRVKR
ncbi:MAG: RNA polymerase sigma factor [Candidatus Acidiferrales bacterium]